MTSLYTTPGGTGAANRLPRSKQLNIGLTPAQYEAVRIAAEEEGATITAYCRDAIMEKAAPVPVIPDVAGLPAWLLHALLFFTRGKTRPVMPSESTGNAKQPNQKRTVC